MARPSLAIYSFGAGVMSPSMEMRADTDRFSRACKEIQNFVVTPQGGVAMRSGSKHIGQPINPLAPARLFTHHNGGDISDMLVEMNAGTSRYWIDDVLVTPSNVPDPIETPNPYSQDELLTVQYDNEERTQITVHANHPPQYITYANRDDVTVTPLPFFAVPSRRYDDAKATTVVTGTTTYQVSFIGTWDGTYFMFTYDGRANRHTGTGLPYPYQYKSNDSEMILVLERCIEECPALANLDSYTVTAAPGAHDYDITLTGEGAGRLMEMLAYGDGPADRTVEVNIETGTIENFGEEPSWSYPFVVTHGGVYYRCTVPHLSDATNEPGVGTLTGAHDGPANSPILVDSSEMWKPGELIGLTVTNTTDGSSGLITANTETTVTATLTGGTDNDWDVADAYSINYWERFWEPYSNGIDPAGTVPPEWWAYQWPDDTDPTGGSNPWVTGTLYGPWDRGWPTAVAFHDQRLFVGGTKDAPTTIWGSQIGQYDYWHVGALANEPVMFSLATTGTPFIQWLASLGGLVAGTTSGIFRISAEATITPSDIHVRKQNAARCEAIRARPVNSGIFFVQLGGRKIMVTEYNDSIAGMGVTDASAMSESLFYQGVKDVALMLTPEALMGCVMGDGTMTLLSLNPDAGISAWQNWVTAGEITDVTSIFNLPPLAAPFNLQTTIGNQEQFYACVRRGDGEYHLEKFIYPPREFGGATTQDFYVYMDSYYEGLVTTSNVLTGIPSRFENDSVRVTVNGANMGLYTVLGGQITLPVEVDGTFAVGYPYLGRVVTYEQSQGNPAGVAFGTARRWNKLWIRLLNSALPKVNGQLPPDRTPSSPMGDPESLRSEDVRLHNLGYGDGSITIEQDLPQPTQIVGLYGQIGVHDA